MYFQLLLLIKGFFSALFSKVSSMNDLLMFPPQTAFSPQRPKAFCSQSLSSTLSLLSIDLFPFSATSLLDILFIKKITFKVSYFINVIPWSVGISLYHAVLKNIIPRPLILGYHLFLRTKGKFYLSPLFLTAFGRGHPPQNGGLIIITFKI